MHDAEALPEIVAYDDWMASTRMRRMWTISGVVPTPLWDAALPGLPGLTHHRFEKSGHTPQLEAPERFDAVLLDWLRSDANPEPCDPGTP